MPDQQGKRGRTVDLARWWGDRATQISDARHLTHSDIADEVYKRAGWRPSDSQVSRCLSNKLTTRGLVEVITEIVGLPSPMFFAETEGEALALEQERQRWRADRDDQLRRTTLEAAAIAAGVAGISERDQSLGVSTEHERSVRRRGSKPRER